MVDPSETQTSSTSDTFDGLDVTLQATLPECATDMFEIDIDITTDGVAPQINLALVVDTSGSTAGNSGSDVDGDGFNDTFLQAEQIAARAFFQNLLDAGYPPSDVTVTLVEYNSGAALVGEFDLTQQAAFDAAVNGLNAGGLTNFEAGLDDVIDAWDARNADANPDNDVDADTTNSVIFLSDGRRNVGDNASDERDELLNDFGARITAIGVGSGSSLSDLQVIDNTGGAERVLDAADLIDVINAPPPLPELDYVEIVVNSDGQPGAEQTIRINRTDVELIETPLGFRIENLVVDGYDFNRLVELEVEVRAVFNNGDDVLVLGGIELLQKICFVTGTRILTPKGLIAVEELSIGDRVVTRDNGVQRITWIGHSRVSADMMERDPTLRPIRFRANALGPQKPARDVFVSRQHKVLVRDWRAEMICGSEEGVLVPAAALVNDQQVTVDYDRTEGFAYYHIACEGHEVVYADGLECESFLPTARNIAGMSHAARTEFLKMFPHLETDVDDVTSARMTMTMKMGRALA
ncbi:MAG: Hint domain-containing protein [Rhodobacteraceae bacterium]|nr:Hint domain-containing protein [Paracoccaceae bacterium]